jgi:hypothetical protein
LILNKKKQRGGSAYGLASHGQTLWCSRGKHSGVDEANTIISADQSPVVPSIGLMRKGRQQKGGFRAVQQQAAR